MKKDRILQQYSKDYLRKLNVSGNTIRNYRADAHHLLCWIKDQNTNITPLDLTDLVISEYFNYLVISKTANKTIKRRMSSIKHFSKFIKSMTLEKDDKISNYISFLKQRGFNNKTIRFYASDLNQFIKWMSDNNIELTEINNEILKSYYYFMVRNQCVNTAKRRLSSARSFSEWLTENNQVEKNVLYVSKYNFINKNISYASMGTAFAVFLLVQIITVDKPNLPWDQNIVKAKENMILNENQNYLLSDSSNFINLLSPAPLIKLNDEQMMNNNNQDTINSIVELAKYNDEQESVLSNLEEEELNIIKDVNSFELQ